MNQLTLWQQQEAPRALTIGDVFEQGMVWADGDTSPEQLERLATLMKGRREVSEWYVKPAYWYRVLDSRVEGERVMMTCQLVESPLSPSQRTDTEEEEELWPQQ